MSTTLFISPHLDDAVLSCAGAMQRAVARKERVIVGTVFSEGSQHAERREEDQRAVRSMGAEAVWLGFEDAPDRCGKYRDFESIIFGLAGEDAGLATRVAEALDEMLRARTVSMVYGPLGAGTHIDHRICFDAMQRMQGEVTVRYYEDRPYCYPKGAAEVRLRELGFDAGEIHERDLLRGFRTLPHVRTYLPPGAMRRHCEDLLMTPLRLSPNWPKPAAEVYSFDAEETRAAHRAATMYASQFADFCGSPQALQRRDARHARELAPQISSPRAERYWTLSANSLIYPPP